jgi:hypothetical protein
MSLEERVKKLEAKVKKLEEWRTSLTNAYLDWKKNLDITQLTPMAQDFLKRLRDVEKKLREEFL